VSPARTGLLLAALLILTALCCLPSIDAPFTFDEQAGIAENRAVHPEASLRQALLYRYSPDQMRPLFFGSLLLDARAHGLRPRGFRITNLALHLLCGLALFALLRRLPAPAEAALSGTAVFLLHPLQSESIIYIWGRSEILAALLSLLCLLLVPWEDRSKGGGGLALWSGALASLSLALLAKEEPIVVPLLAFLWWTLAESRPPRGAALRSAALLAPVVFFLVLRRTALGALGRQVFARGFAENVLGQAVVALRTLRLVVLPVGQSVDPLALDPSPAVGWAALLVCVAIVAGALFACRRLRGGLRLAAAGVIVAATGGLIYWMAPLPDLMSERRIYLSMAGVALSACGLVAAALAAMPEQRAAAGPEKRAAVARGRRPAAVARLAWLAPVVLAAILAPLLLQRSRLWADPVLLWEEARRLAPDKARPLINLGVLAAERSERDRAADYFDRVVRLEPRNAEALYNRGKLRLDRGDARGAASDLETAVEADPTLPRIWINLGLARLTLDDTSGAREALAAALEIDPGEPRALTNLAEIQRSEGRLDEAIRLYRQALASDPGYAHAAARLGVALESAGDRAGALAAYREYIARGARSALDRDAVLAKIRSLEEAGLSPER
jgi:tetratricopeptide (TPR) repeat protein